MRLPALPTSRSTTLLPWLLACAALAPTLGHAADPAAESPQVVVPEVDRRDVRVPRFPSNDFEAGLFGGVYSTQNFGASGVGGLRLGYHITEDYFVEASLGRTTVSDAAFKRVLPGGIFTPGNETLQYVNLSAGVNLLPGEIFIGRNNAKPSVMYLLGGVGTTRFNGQRQQTFNLGLGMKVLLADWVAVRVDMRDHVFSLDLLGKRESTHNLELTTGVSFFF
jgi:outer membrane beta-barrel protein